MFETGSRYATTSNSCWKDATLEKVNADNWYGFTSNSGDRGVNIAVGNSQTTYDKYALTEQTVSSGLEAVDAKTAYEAVVAVSSLSDDELSSPRAVAFAGASLPRYDEVDRRLLDEAAGVVEPQFYGVEENGSASRGTGIINSQNDIVLAEHDTFTALHETTGTGVGEMEEITSWPFLGMREGEMLMPDTDGDGLPDGYEREAGLDPDDPSDGAAITEGGYSNLEIFLNGVADGTIRKSNYETLDPTGISSVGTEKAGVLSRTYYNMGGVGTGGNVCTGINIVKENLSDGKVSVRKVAVK